uniref:Uncharacterized protein n=1 Tax=Rhipicephalus pulchellus TaxID=72859 RepID=L7LV47_RHIPC
MVAYLRALLWNKIVLDFLLCQRLRCLRQHARLHVVQRVGAAEAATFHIHAIAPDQRKCTNHFGGCRQWAIVNFLIAVALARGRHVVLIL